MSNRHGTREYRTYRAWQMLKQRCDNPHTSGYERYGGVGVDYDPRWKVFETFLADAGLAPTIEHTLDRKDSSRGYWPDNIRWATHQEQQSNLKSNRRITFNDETHTYAEWARHLGMSREGFRLRVKRVGEQAAIQEGPGRTPSENALIRWYGK